MSTEARDFSTATRVRNVATGTVYVRVRGASNYWRTPGVLTAVTTSQLEALIEMVAEHTPEETPDA